LHTKNLQEKGKLIYILNQLHFYNDDYEGRRFYKIFPLPGHGTVFTEPIAATYEQALIRTWKIRINL
jgi:hypothetical protein